MSGAADKARALANNVKDIPKSVPVSVRFTDNFSVIGQHVASLINSKNKLAGMGIGHNAAGTNNWRGGPTWVGERGPEIVNLPRGAQVIPNHKIGGGATDLSQATIEALAAAIARRPNVLDGRVMAASVDRRVGAALR